MPSLSETLSRIGSAASAPAPGGSSVVKGSAVLNLAGFECDQTVTLTGCTPSSVVTVTLAHHSDADENSADLLDVAGLSAQPLTDSTRVTASFSTWTTGPVRINLLAA